MKPRKAISFDQFGRLVMTFIFCMAFLGIVLEVDSSVTRSRDRDQVQKPAEFRSNATCTKTRGGVVGAVKSTNPRKGTLETVSADPNASRPTTEQSKSGDSGGVT